MNPVSKPNCEEVHRLVSEGLDRELSALERARVHSHLLLCRACRNFEDQLAFLRKAMRRFPGPGADEKDEPHE